MRRYWYLLGKTINPPVYLTVHLLAYQYIVIKYSTIIICIDTK